MSEGGLHKYWLIGNNEFQNSGTGILLNGTNDSKNENISISNNIFGNQDDALTLSNSGITVSYTNNLAISDNKFLNIKNPETNPSGIVLGTETTNAAVFNNIISGIVYTGAEGYGGKGIDINTGNSTSAILVYNNAISGISGDGYDNLSTDAITGIRIDGTTGSIKLNHNSVNLSGKIMGSNPGNISTALYIGRNVSGIGLLNNIFVNSIEDIKENATAYAIYSDAPKESFSEINFNNYYASGSEGILGYSGSNLLELADWKAATGQDVNSVSFLPAFLSDTDLHIVNSGHSGTPVPEVTTDADGVKRDANHPDIGAYETTGTGSIKDVSADHSDFIIYSCNDIIYLKAHSETSTARVFNSKGQQVFILNLQSNSMNQIKVNHPGIYIISVKSRDQVYTTKVFCR